MEPIHLHAEILPISKVEKEIAFAQKGITIWFSGLSGSGKSTLSKLLEKKLFELGHKTVLLDGDNTRMHLNRDLGFSLEDRQENIRRIAEVSKILNDSGIITLSCFISPTEEIRDLAESIIGKSNFYLIYTNSSIETCIKRDPKGLYKKAIEHKIPDFTGISSPFEAPLNHFIEVSTEMSVQESFELLWEALQKEVK
jgi:adenylyl-sulfate kinase